MRNVSRSGPRKYLLTDILDPRWSRSSNSFEGICKVAKSRRQSKPGSALQLYRLGKGEVYRAIELPEEHKGSDKACTRNGVLCGHRRPLISSHVITRCLYILDTGEKRGCPLGRECTRYTAEKCRERDDLPIDY